MRRLLHDLLTLLAGFESWFDHRYGWFFTNGMKHRRPARRAPQGPLPRSAPPMP